MNLRVKFVLSIGLLGLLCFMLPGSIRADTVNINSINANSSPFFVDISTTNLLAQYGITLVNVTPGTTVAVLCGECGGNSIVPSSPPNTLTQFGNDNGMSYTLQFSTPLSTLSFNLAGNSKSGGSGTVVAAWSATAFDASGNVVSSVGDPSLFSTFSPFAPQPFTLTGPGIASVTFFTQCFNFCGTVLNIADLSAPEIKLKNTTLSAPTNLHATQVIGSNGTKIHLTWDYGTNPIDGFVIEREAPSGSFEELASRPLAGVCVSGHCAVDDAGPTVGGSAITPYGTYSYRVRAFQAQTESDPSNTATCFQLNILFENGGIQITGLFTPDGLGFLSQVTQELRTANIADYDHFNWISVINRDNHPLTDSAGNRLVAPYLDPPFGGYGAPSPQQADNLPYYWDEPAMFLSSRFYIFSTDAGGRQDSSVTAAFRDIPMEPLLAPGEYLSFFTTLVGVKTTVGADPTVTPPNYRPLVSFAWYSTYNGSMGGVGKRFNLDPPTIPGTGGIFNAQIVEIQDLPLSVRELLIQVGAQGVSTAPKIDTDAPTTAAFFSGPQGANGSFTGPISVMLIATDIDGPTDIASTTYNIDAGPVLAYSGPFTISGDGIHTIQFGSTDQAGNVETPRSQTIKLGATPPSITCAGNPSILWPPNGKTVSVTVSGKITGSTSGVNVGSARFAVIDGDGQVQPSGSIALGSSGNYSFSLSLVASRLGSDKDGRQYTIVVSASDNAGKVGSCSTVVIVPHDQGH